MPAVRGGAAIALEPVKFERFQLQRGDPRGQFPFLFGAEEVRPVGESLRQIRLRTGQAQLGLAHFSSRPRGLASDSVIIYVAWVRPKSRSLGGAMHEIRSSILGEDKQASPI